MPDRIAVDALTTLLTGAPAVADGAAGWKVALNFPAVQRKLGLTHALAAPLPSLQTYSSGERLGPTASPRLHVEAELALRLGADVRTLSAPLVVAWAAPCLELVDYALPRDGLTAMFAHSFFHAGVVLGAPRALAEVTLPQPYPRVGERERLPGCVPDDVLDALQDLRALVIAAGGTLRKGQLVLCGSYIEPAPLMERVDVDFGPALGTLSIAR
jgi:2-keto-4-pentenoate hydratase